MKPTLLLTAAVASAAPVPQLLLGDLGNYLPSLSLPSPSLPDIGSLLGGGGLDLSSILASLPIPITLPSTAAPAPAPAPSAADQLSSFLASLPIPITLPSFKE